MATMLITPFDPWESKLCTCPKKLTLNPYTGCSHGCLYCYASSYVQDFYHARPKKNLIPQLEKEAIELEGELISIANSSDPYPPTELALGITRKCLQILSKHHCKIQLVTKSSLVTRDIDILKKTPSIVSMTITTEDNKLAKLLEPLAPPPSKRFKAVSKLLQNGIPVSVRIDPLIPIINDDPERLVRKLASIGVSHVTCSTYKAKHDNWKRVAQAFPMAAKSLSTLYFDKGERKGRTLYLPRSIRKGILEKAKEFVEEEGMRFACCREGFPQLNSATCDGSWLISDS
jgi:DNA repair photolyase